MIELPEAQARAAQLDELLAGKTILKVQALQTPHGFAFFRGDAQSYPPRLEGLRVAGATACGGRPELRFDAPGLRLSFGEGVNLRWYAPGSGQKLPAKHQFLMEFDNGGVLVCTVQMYGFFGIFDSDEDAKSDYYYWIGCEKPSPLGDAFNFAYFETLRGETGANKSLKAFLATEQRIPGLGNGVLQDILWRAGMHHKRKLSTLSDDAFAALYRAVKETLAEMTALGGRDTEKDLFGNPGGYKTIMSRNTKLCPACAGPITRMAYLGGNVYLCGHCQSMG